MSTKYDFLIIGGGIVGAATAYAIAQRFPGKSLAVIEKESAPACHQSSHNSGVIHAGIYYAPDSFKAKLCRAGLAATYQFAAEHEIATKRTGKLLVATSAAEVGRLQQLSTRAQNNGVDVRDISAGELAELEPNINGLSAMLVSDTGIVDYAEMTRALLSESHAECLYDMDVREIRELSQEVVVSSLQTTLRAERLIACAGLQADRLAALAGLQSEVNILPFRGDFYVLDPRFGTMFQHLIYPVPDPRLPFLGVHLTKHIDGSVSVGPSAMLALAREAYGKYKFNLRDCKEIIATAGFWRLLAKYPRATLNELAMTFSIKLYAKAARRYCPQISAKDFVGHRCGIRAQAINRRGELVHDFLFERTNRMLHVLNAPSPAATAAIPIGRHIVESL